MALPVITLPKIELPFDISVLWHPVADHFVIAVPVIIIFLELVNLIAKKRVISVVSLLLLTATVFLALAAYITGGIDAKEAFDGLSEVGQSELKEHKLLGTYLLLASPVVLFFKLLSMAIGRGLVKALYLLVLILFVVSMLNQGKEGGKLVYEHGANVAKVKALDDELFDANEALDEASEKIKTFDEVLKEKSTVEATVETVVPATEVNTTEANITAEDVKKEVLPEVKEKVEVLQVEDMPEEVEEPKIDMH